MEEKKNSNMGLIIFLVVLVLGLAGYICYDKLLKKEPAKTEEKESKAKDSFAEDEVIYKDVIDEYKALVVDDLSEEEAEEKYQYANPRIREPWVSNKRNLKYVFYDINSDGKDEMLVGPGYAIYSFDGSKVTSLFKDEDGCLAYRCSLTIYDNGLIYFYGSGGAYEHSMNFYNIDSNSNLQMINSYYVVYSRDNDDSVIIYDGKTYDYRTATGTKLDYSSEEEIISENVKNSKPIVFTGDKLKSFN